MDPRVSILSRISHAMETDAIFRWSDGALLSFHHLLDELESSTVIFMGETHDRLDHHQNQLRTLRGLVERGRDVVVGMEMFERSQQPILDRWSDGKLTVEQFLKDVDWKKTWGIDFDLYRGILLEAKDRRLKVLGLNIDRDLVRRVGQYGIADLSPEDRERLPEMDLNSQEHRRYIASIYKDHRGGLAKDFERFYQAQCLWDEAMAETLSSFLQSEEGRGKTILVIAGSGHVAFGLGIPKRLYRRVPVRYRTILLKEWRRNIENDLNLEGSSLPPADFLWMTRGTTQRKEASISSSTPISRRSLPSPRP